MSEPDDSAATIERLQRRVAREKAARLQAETIAERVTSDRWELRQQLEDKLALRTSELEAARRAASETVTERERHLAALTHDLRTPLTALYFLSESLSAGTALSAGQLEELRLAIANMRAALDALTVDGGRHTDVAQSTQTLRSLADIVAAREADWHQLAARAGKLLILDVETPPGQICPTSPDDVNERVTGLIAERLHRTEPVIEVHLSAGPDGLELR